MNEYDSELIRSILSKAGYTFAQGEDAADIILLNTCSVRDNAVRRVRGHIHDIYHEHKGEKPIIGVLGCMATNFREALLEDKNLKIDFIAGPDSYKRLPELIRKCCAAKVGANGCPPLRKAFDITLSEFETYSDVIPARVPGVNAWIAVMRGCDNFCTFCVVPYARGRERSRSPENIIEEARRAADEGFSQVTLLGQNVNSYFYPLDADKNNPRASFLTEGKKRQGDGATFASLLAKVAQVDGIKRIRFMSPHPKDFPPELLETVAQNPKVCKHIHLPLQSGNDRILKLMNRGYTQEDYFRLVEHIRKLCPGISLTTDIIVGFPTETDSDFKDTFEIMRDLEFDSAFIFKYSPRPGTVAAKRYADDVSADKKTGRITKLNEIQKQISLKKNKAFVGKVLEVLIEQKGTSRSNTDFQGRTDGNKLVILKTEGLVPGEIIPVTITDASANTLKGQPYNQNKKWSPPGLKPGSLGRNT